MKAKPVPDSRGTRPGIHVLLLRRKQDVDGRDISAFTRVFDALCPAMTTKWVTYSSA
jgi:hypothetical protein